jgi:ribose-phosphate pyrophosphokinase
VPTFDAVLPGRRGVALTADELLGGLDHAVCHKTRHGDHAVDVALPDTAVAGRAVVLLDEVASTGRTLAEAARGALSQGALSVDVAVTHALFVGDALAWVQAAGVRHVWGSDAVPHAGNAVSIVPLLAQALRG